MMYQHTFMKAEIEYRQRRIQQEMGQDRVSYTNNLINSWTTLTQSFIEAFTNKKQSQQTCIQC